MISAINAENADNRSKLWGGASTPLSQRYAPVSDIHAVSDNGDGFRKMGFRGISYHELTLFYLGIHD
jgi:hypothetical protein